MKNKKLLLGCVFFTSIVLGGCGKNSTPSESSHTHKMVFDSFVWTTTAGNYTAKAKYKCSANDGHFEHHVATMSKTTTAPTHTVAGANHWKASYGGHEDTKDEALPATGHVWNAVGLCLADGAFNGKTVTVGVDSERADYQASKTYFFRMLAEPGHTYQLSNSGVTPGEVESYYLDTNGEPHLYNKSTVPFPSEGTHDSYIYFVHKPNLPELNAALHVDYKSHHERADDHGFCLDHPSVYVGFEIDTDDLIDLGDFDGTHKEFRKFQANSIHKYGLNLPGSEPLEDSDFTFYLYHEDSGFSTTSISSADFNMIPQFNDLSSDGWVYVCIHPTTAKVDAAFGVDSEHSFNTVGICPYDNEFVGGSANTLEPGQSCDEEPFVNGITYYYRVKAYAGHTYEFVPNHWQPSRNEYYYIQDGGMVLSYDLANEFPNDSKDNYIYIVYNPTYVDPTNGYFRLDLVSHPIDSEHGRCPHNVAIELTNGIAYNTNFSIPVDGYAFFKAELANIQLDSWDQFELYYGHDHYTYVTLWFSLNGTWVEFEATDGGNINYGVYDVSDAHPDSSDPALPVEPDDGWIYIQMHNVGASPLAVTGANLGINI